MLKRFFMMYVEGFRTMDLTSRKLWLIILVKLFIMFAILKVFFFPDLLNKHFESDSERSDQVLQELTK